MKFIQPREKFAYETAMLSAISVALQGLGLLFNLFLTRRLGAASVGVFTLMGSFFGMAVVFGSGSGFLAASRFLSEEIGCHGNPKQVFRYVIRFCMTLSTSVCLLLCIFADPITGLLSKTGANTLSIRLLALCLPLCAFAACLKGRCYAYSRVFHPAFAEGIEFLVRAGTMAFCAQFLIPCEKISLLTAFAVSMLAGQSVSVGYLAALRIKNADASEKCFLSFGQFLRKILPVMGNACLVSALSSANDALVPLTLLQFGASPQEALAQFGEFEAIIIPTLFFPSVVQCCLSGLLVPALSKARAANDTQKIRELTERVFEQTCAFSLFVVLMLRLFGAEIGRMLGGDAFTGQILRLMAPIVPFIYLEIIMEGILRGMGKQNFSSFNYLAEYVVRISVLLICVPLFGFYGIVASYLACNLSGNAVRFCFVRRVTGLRPNWKQIFFYPAFSLFLSFLLTKLCLYWLPLSTNAYLYAFPLLCGIGMLGFLRLLRSTEQKSAQACPAH